MRAPLLVLAVFSLAACGGPELSDEPEEQLATVARIEGRVLAATEPLAGAYVIALDKAGTRVGRAVTAADGRYALDVSAMPWRLAVKAANRVPRTVTQPSLRKITSTRFGWDTDVGPMLGADGTYEALTYVVADAASSPRLVPQVAWGLGGSIGSPQDELVDLTVGARLGKKLTSLLPVGTQVAPNAADSVQRVGSVLEVRFNEKLSTQQLGSAYEALLIEQIVATASINYSAEKLPVRIRVRCASCSGGYADLADAHIGGGPYAPHTARPEAAYSDLAGARYARHVAMAKGLGFLGDFAAGAAFQPAAAVTRAEVAALLVRALDLPLVNPLTPSFTDVKKTDWFYKAVETARARGLMSGTSTFKPAGTVTRAELAAFVANAGKWPAANPTRATFSDVPRSYWAFSRIETAYGWCHSVESRTPGSVTFEPAASATRAEATAAMTRMLDCWTER